MEAMGNAALEMGKGEERTLLSRWHSLWVLRAWGQCGAKRDTCMLSAGKDGAGEKHLQHRALRRHFSELNFRQVRKFYLYFVVRFRFPPSLLESAYGPIQPPALKCCKKTLQISHPQILHPHVAAAESGPQLLFRQLQSGVNTQNAVKTNNLWSTPSE